MPNFRQLIAPVFLIMVLSCHNQNSSEPSTQPSNPAANPSPSPAASHTKNIVFFGNSLTAGYGVNPDQAFPAIIGRRIDSLHLPYTVVNAGVSGETSADGRTRIGWVLRQPVDIFILELGGNDGLRGIPLTGKSGTSDNLQAIIDSVKIHYPDASIVIAGMQIPPNMGPAYTESFKNIFPKLSADNNAALIPFLLQNVGGIPRLNQADGIHPTAAGHRIVAENVWQILQPLLKK
jgi:acyl-CoA thioesterase-1